MTNVGYGALPPVKRTRPMFWAVLGFIVPQSQPVRALRS